MTREAFIKVLDKKGYSYKIEGDKIVVTHGAHVILNSLTSLPPSVEFNNEDNVSLNSLTSLPPGVEFRNRGYVYLDALTSLPPGVVFNNGGDVYLNALIGDWIISDWKGNIKGVDSTRLLKLMIKQGVFER